MFHIHLTVGMFTTSQDCVRILLHVLSSCDGVLSFPSAAELRHIRHFLTRQGVSHSVRTITERCVYIILTLHLFLLTTVACMCVCGGTETTQRLFNCATFKHVTRLGKTIFCMVIAKVFFIFHTVTLFSMECFEGTHETTRLKCLRSLQQNLSKEKHLTWRQK